VCEAGTNNKNGVCYKCKRQVVRTARKPIFKRDRRDIALAKQLTEQGLSLAQVAKQFEVSRQAIFYWLHPNKK
jgi:transposase-like protein